MHEPSEDEDTRDRFTKWYDRQSFDVLFLIGISPLVGIALILTVIALMFGGGEPNVETCQ